MATRKPSPDKSSRKAADAYQAVACTGGNGTRLEARETEKPGPGEMLLGLRAVGLCGTDLYKLDNGLAAPGTVLGHELVGEVLALGRDVSAFGLGDRVAVPHHVPCGTCTLCRSGSETMCERFRDNLLSPGGFAERILVRSKAVSLAARHVPDSLSDETAVFMEPAACVLRGIQRSGVSADGIAVVQGAGSMGLLHVLILRALHPGVHIVIVDPVPARRALAVEFGASAADTGDDALSVVRDASRELGADAVFDTVGGAGPLNAALDLSREGGSVVLFAHARDGETAGFDLNDLFRFERRIIGSYSASLSEQAEIFALMVAGRFDPSSLVTHRLPLQDFQKGVDLVRRRQALKVLYVPAIETRS